MACNTTLDPSDVRRPSSLGPSTQRTRVCLYVTLINNTVDVVSFSELFVQFILHTAATVVWNYRYVTEMAPGQKTPHESSSFLVRCRTPCLSMHGLKYPPFYQS